MGTLNNNNNKKKYSGNEFSDNFQKTHGSLSQVDVNESTMKITSDGNDVAGLQEKTTTRPRFVADQLFKLLQVVGKQKSCAFHKCKFISFFINDIQSRENAIFFTVLSFHYTIDKKKSKKTYIFGLTYQDNLCFYAFKYFKDVYDAAFG